MDRFNKGSSVEPIRPKREASVNVVRSNKSRGTCKTSKIIKDGDAEGMDYV